MEFKCFLENNFEEIYSSTLKFFPTTKRQNLIDTIKILNLEWSPFLGVKTLFVKGLAENIDNKKQYNPIILFKNIKYYDNKNSKSVNLKVYNKNYFLEKIDKNDILVRCNCKDFIWRGNYADYLNKCLYGRKRSKYKSKNILPSINPNNNIMICKHLIKMYKVLSKSGILSL